MKNKLSKIICATAMAAIGIVGVLAPVSSVYATDPFCDKLTEGTTAYEAAGCAETGDLKLAIKNILLAVIGVAGFVAVIFIIVGGVNYMTSAGDTNKITKAKQTILYALIGLIICALAFAIVNWTIGVVNKSDKKSDEDKSYLIETSIAKIIE